MKTLALSATLQVAACTFCAVVASAQEATARPSFRSASPVSETMLRALSASAPGTAFPFETPASIACVYHLIPTTDTGCAVGTTHALPTGGSGLIVIVNAYDDPAARDDLNVFSQLFGLPPCNGSNPCFETVYATGSQPPIDPLWAVNGADAVQYAHAFAPQAKILLVEAASASVADLNFAVNFANHCIATHSPAQTAEMILPMVTSNRPARWLTTRSSPRRA